jgi:hypothetical protein
MKASGASHRQGQNSSPSRRLCSNGAGIPMAHRRPKKPGFDWLYLQMIQQQDARGYFAGKFKVILAKVVE